MKRWITPPRQRGVELLDLPETPDAARLAAMRDLERSNVLFGGTRSVAGALREARNRGVRVSVLVDVATGTGDIPAGIRPLLGPGAVIIGVDLSPALLAAARGRLDAGVAADASCLPLPDGAADVVLCSQALHHFFDDDLRRLIAELHRVARGVVIVSDLRRSRIAAAAFSMASRLFRFHALTRRDGVTSVMRGFTAGELRDLVSQVTGVTPEIRSGLFWRLTAMWTKPQGRISSP